MTTINAAAGALLCAPSNESKAYTLADQALTLADDLNVAGDDTNLPSAKVQRDGQWAMGPHGAAVRCAVECLYTVYQDLPKAETVVDMSFSSGEHSPEDLERYAEEYDHEKDESKDLDDKLAQARNPFRNLKAIRTDSDGWYRVDHDGRAFYIHQTQLGKKGARGSGKFWVVTACDDYPEISREQRTAVADWIVRWLCPVADSAAPGGTAFRTLRAAKRAILSATLLYYSTLKKEQRQRKETKVKRQIARSIVRKIRGCHAPLPAWTESHQARVVEALSSLSDEELSSFCVITGWDHLDTPSQD